MRHESIVPEASSAAIPPAGGLAGVQCGAPRGFDTLRAQCDRYLRHAGRWVGTSELCQHTGRRPDAVIPSLRVSERHGSVEVRTVSRAALQWRWKPEYMPGPGPFSIDWPPGFVSRWDQARRECP